MPNVINLISMEIKLEDRHFNSSYSYLLSSYLIKKPPADWTGIRDPTQSALTSCTESVAWYDSFNATILTHNFTL